MRFCSWHAKYCVPVLAAVLMCACTNRLPYREAGLEQRAGAEQFQARSANDTSLADLVHAAGYEGQWPPSQWNLETLTLLGLYFNPDVDVARPLLTRSKTLVSLSKRSLRLVEYETIRLTTQSKSTTMTKNTS